MRGSYRWMAWGLALGAAAFVTACDEAAGPLEAGEAQIEAAPSLAPQGLLGELATDGARQAELEPMIASLHEALLAAHEAHAGVELPGELDGDALPSVLAAVHERHDRLMASLTDDERERFLRHMHEVMAGHADPDRLAEAHGHLHSAGGEIDR